MTTRPCSWRAAVLTALCLAGSSIGARAQEDARPPEVALIQDFGSNGVLTQDGMRQYLKNRAFVPLDLNENGALDVDEYRAARLYARKGDCSAENVIDRFATDKQQAGGQLTAATLYTVHPLWRDHIEAMTTAHWKRTGASADTPTVGVEAVRAYFAAEQSRKAAPTAAFRAEALRQRIPRNATSIETSLREYLADEAFRRADQDGSGGVDFFEFVAAYPQPEAAREFCVIEAGGNGVLDETEFRTDNNAAAPYHQRTLLALMKRTLDDVLLADVPEEQLARADRVFKEQEEAAAAEARLKNLSSRGYVPGFGYLIRGKRKVEEKKIVHDQNVPALFIRVIKDFTIDDPRTAEPATFSLTKEEDKKATVAMDATFQVDFEPARRTLRGVSAGVDVERNTATSTQRHRQRYYTTLDLFFFRSGRPIEAQWLRIAPFIENNDRKDVTRLAGAVIWEPSLHIGRFLTSAYRPLGRHARWYVAPRGVLELATVLRGPDAEEDGTHARLELLWGLGVADRFNVTFKTFQRHGIANDLGHSHFEELSAWWNVDELKRFSLKTSFSWGKAVPTDDDHSRKLTAGIGVKF